MKWEKVKIEDVCEINPHRPNGVLPNEFVTILPMACVSEDGRITSHSVIRNDEVKVGLTPFQLNDILVAKITPCFENGKGTIVKGINSFYGYGSTEFHVLRSGVSIEPRYLFYLTRTTDFRKKGQKSMTGSAGQKRVPEFFLRTYSFPLPPLHIQQQIADTLDKADALRRKDQELLKKYDELAKAIFYDMFGDPVRNEKRWEKAILRDVVNVMGGKRLPAGNSFENEITPFPYIRVTNFRNLTVDVTDLKYISYETHEKIKKYTISADDVFISIAGTIGLCGIIPNQINGANLTENAAKLVIIDKSKIFPLFLATFLMSNYGQSEIQKRKMVVGVPKLALFRIEEIEIIIPPIEIQKIFVDKINNIELQKNRTSSLRNISDNLFSSLLYQYFS